MRDCDKLRFISFKWADDVGRGGVWGWCLVVLLGAGVLFPASVCWAKPLAHWEVKKDVLEVWLRGVYRPRFEWMQRRDLREPSEISSRLKDDVFINHRARLGVGARLVNRLTFFMELADVRRWGTDPNDFSANGLDLYRIWLEVKIVESLSVKAGRMELNYDGKRLSGNADWRPQARSFDAIQLKFEPGALQFHLVYAKLSDAGDPESDRHRAFFWFHYRELKVFQPSVYYMLDYLPQDKQLRHTTGVYLKGGVSGFFYTAEFFLQFGSYEDLSVARDIFAWMAAFSAGYEIAHFTKPTFLVWAELLSGKDGDSTSRDLQTFVTTFGNNHKHYGLMDFFLNIPVHTRNAGLVDTGVGFRISPIAPLFLRLDIHYFRLFAPLRNLAGEQVQDLGVEFDFVAKYTMFGGFFSLTAVYGLMVPFADQGFSALGKGNQVEQWLALQAELKF